MEDCRHTFDGDLYVLPGFIHVSLELPPSTLICIFQLAEVLPSFRLFGLQCLEIFFMLRLGVHLH